MKSSFAIKRLLRIEQNEIERLQKELVKKLKEIELTLNGEILLCLMKQTRKLRSTRHMLKESIRNCW